MEREAHYFQARWVYPVAADPIRNGWVGVYRGHICGVGRGTPPHPVQDLGNAALLPAPVNAHTHLEFSHLAEPLGKPGIALADWLRLVIRRRNLNVGEQGATRQLSTIQFGLRQIETGGAVAVGDIVQDTRSADRTAHGLLHETVFLERRGSSTERVAEQMAALMDWVGTSGQRPSSPARHVGISPHAPYSVSREHLAAIVDVARRNGLPLAMHVAESPDELRWLADQSGPLAHLLEELRTGQPHAWPARTTVQDVVRMLAAAPRALVIHGNYLTAGDLEIMAQLRDRLAIVYCPRTHAYFGHDPYPLAVMRRHGLRVALGTDSLASNPDLHVWREWVALVERHPDVHPSQALRCLTMDGAWALGWEDVLGTIEAGKLARLCVLPLEDESGTEPYECLRRSAHHLPAPVALPGAEANAATIESAPSGGGPSHG